MNLFVILFMPFKEKTMYFTESAAPGTSMAQHLPRITVVAILHVVVFLMIAHSMGVRSIGKVLDGPMAVEIKPEVQPTPPPPPPPVKNDFKPEPENVLTPVIPPPIIPATTSSDQPTIHVPVGDQNPQPPGPPTDTGTGTGTGTLPPGVKPAPVRIKAVVDAAACTKPEYPKNSVRNEEQGTVTLGFLVGTDGRVIDSRIEKTSGHKDLDKAARQALSLCKFKPGTVDGLPQESWASLQYEWKLE
jgi:periplasmic protein TonB